MQEFSFLFSCLGLFLQTIYIYFFGGREVLRVYFFALRKKKEMGGGGKMDVELINDYVEVRLYGRSTNYGHYNPDCVNIEAIEGIIHTMFELLDLPILVVPDFEA